MNVIVLLLQRELRNTRKERIDELLLRHCALYNFQNIKDDYPLYIAIFNFISVWKKSKKAIADTLVVLI